MLPPLYDLELGILIGLERPLEAIDAGWAAFELTRRAYGEAHPQSIRFLVNVGAALGSAGLYDESIDVFERALALRKRRGLPANADALELWRNLASSYSNAQDPERAIETIDRALRLPVPRHQAASTRGQLIALLTEIHVGLGNPQFAQRRFDEELVRLGDDPGSKRELASSLLAAAEKYRLLGRHDEAYTLERLGLSAMPSAAVPSGPPPQPALDPPQSGHS
jgi:tetratricopeptide (TPR) repeat protein